jgi:serine protease Do
MNLQIKMVLVQLLYIGISVMLNRYFLAACAVVMAIVIFASQASAQESLPISEVAKIARATVVQIEPTANSVGSGVIIGRYQEQGTNVYVVLTANKLVQNKNNDYYIITPFSEGSQGKKRQKILVSPDRDIEILAGGELALVRFRSELTYETSTLCESSVKNKCAGFYVAGFANRDAAVKQRIFQFTSQLENKQPSDEEEASDDTIKINWAGMTGGPIFDLVGRVVGIYHENATPGTSRSQSVEVQECGVGSSGTRGTRGGISRAETRLAFAFSIQGVERKVSEPNRRLVIKRSRLPFNFSAATRGCNTGTMIIEPEDEAGVEFVHSEPAKRSLNPLPSSPLPQDTPSRQTENAPSSGWLF